MFQNGNLIPFLTARENVRAVMAFGSQPPSDTRAQQLLQQVGLGDRAGHRPGQLSGGEAQRVAIAVALANDPALLLADELTGELDSATAEQILDLVMALGVERGLTILLVTHNPASWRA